MQSRVYIIFLAVLVCSCGNDITQKVPITTQKVESKIKPEQKPVAPKINLITNKNVEERLLAYGEENTETIVLIKTEKGNIKIRLFKDTPLHRSSFILLAKNGCLDNTVFTRVSKGFMAQGGGTYDEKIVEKRNSIGRYTIPAEIKNHHYHKQGVVAAARSYNNNPDKRSNPFAFYFVEGTTYNDLTLDKYEEVNHYKYPKAHRNYYLNHPGAAHIDGQHTVFGEIIEGMNVIPILTSVKTDSRDWPEKDIFITEVIVVK